MSGVYLGDSGHIEIRRRGMNSSMSSILDPADVNVARRRFSFDFESEALISGDQIEIATEDGSTLELVDGHIAPDGRWFCHVDDAGGIRLYDNFEDAINGDESNALALVAPTRNIPILARTRNSAFLCVADVTSYEMTTSRDAVDITQLGSEHRQHYASGLISGQGRLSCFWDYEKDICSLPTGAERVEVAHYFAQLVLRLQQGASFDGRFYLKSAAPGSLVWWEALCIVTNVAMSFDPTQPIVSNIDFVTTGPVHLRVGEPPNYLLQEDRDLLLQEDNESGILLED